MSRLLVQGARVAALRASVRCAARRMLHTPVRRVARPTSIRRAQELTSTTTTTSASCGGVAARLGALPWLNRSCIGTTNCAQASGVPLSRE